MTHNRVPNTDQLCDIEAIKQLKALYCYFADSGQDAEAFADLFTEDGVLDEGDDGIFKGRAAIVKMYKSIWPYLRMNQHLVMNPVIEINGLQATGNWKLLQFMTTRDPEGDRALMAAGYYNERYVKVEGAWRFQHVSAGVHFCCDAASGWATEPFAAMFSEPISAELGIAPPQPSDPSPV